MSEFAHVRRQFSPHLCLVQKEQRRTPKSLNRVGTVEIMRFLETPELLSYSAGGDCERLLAAGGESLGYLDLFLGWV